MAKAWLIMAAPPVRYADFMPFATSDSLDDLHGPRNDVAIDTGPGVLLLRGGADRRGRRDAAAGAAEGPRLWTVGGRVQLSEVASRPVMALIPEEGTQA